MTAAHEGRLRVLTINIWGEQPPLDRRMELLVEGIRALEPDVVGLQEVREVPGHLPNQAATLAAALGFAHAYAPATPWGGGDEGVAILSRLPISARETAVLPASTEKERRVVLMTRIDARPAPVNCYVTHLNYRLVHGIEREQQVAALDDFVKAHTSDAPQILMGDFNATPEHDEIRFLRGLHTLAGRRVFYQDAYERRHPREAGFTWARRNPYTERMRWLERDRRLDYVFVTPMSRDGRGVVQDCRIVLDKPDAEGVYPSDHFGVYAEIQIAPLGE
jgi:endonuclease/exonuclease/phosphatase family metal-dependent hydrolase